MRSDRPLHGHNSPELVILGLDGATWDLMQPMLDAGELPNLQRVIQKGASGTLQSMDPMSSPRLWTSIATGLSAEQHGVEGFFGTRNDLKAPRIFDICQLLGRRVGLFSWLVTWPVFDYFSFVIPSWMAQSPQTLPMSYACCQEINLEQGLRGEFCPVSSLFRCALQGATLSSVQEMSTFYLRDWIGMDEEERFYRKISSEVDLQTDLFIRLLRERPVQVATFTLYGTDKLAHRYWHYMSPQEFGLPRDDHPYAQIIPDYYRRADRAFGRILKILSPSCHVVLLSDHGFRADTAMPRQFFMNIPELLRNLGANRLVTYSDIQREVQLAPRPGVNSAERSHLRQGLEDIVFKDSLEPVFQVKEDESGHLFLRTQFSLTWHEDSPLLLEESLLIGNRQVPVDKVFFSRTFSGNHDPRGIIVLAGPKIRTGGVVESAGLLDIAPTLLYLLNLPVSRELPGRILSEAFLSGFEDENHPIYIDAYPPLEQIQSPLDMQDEQFLERLKSVGYI